MLTATSWTMLIATVVGLVVARTPLARFPGAADARQRAAALLVAVLASQSNFAGMAPRRCSCCAACSSADPRAAAGACRRAFRFDLYLCGISSLAHIGGVASAPVLAATYSPALVPVAVLLALLGYVLGTGFGLSMAACCRCWRHEDFADAPWHCFLARSAAPRRCRASSRRSAHGVIGVTDAQLDPDFWIRRWRGPRSCSTNRDRGAEREAASGSTSPSMTVARCPRALTRSRCRMVERMSARPTRHAVRRDGTPVEAATLDALVEAVDLAAIPAAAGDALWPGGATRRPAHVPHRAARVHHAGRHRHRSLPGKRAVPRHAGGDRAREPRRRVVVRGESALRGVDRARNTWPRARRRTCSASTSKRHSVVVTGASARTRCTRRKRPEVSELQLDMGSACRC